MGIEKVPLPGRLVVGVLWTRDEDLQEAEERLSGIFGGVNLRSERVPFQRYTRYYDGEMGEGLQRCLWSFLTAFPRGGLADAKLATNRIERAMARDGRRVVNLDPGILTPEALSLATTKPYSHRLYLSKGIFGELTLVYRQDRYEPLPWTYPDYREEWSRTFLETVREELMESAGRKGRRKDRTSR